MGRQLLLQNRAECGRVIPFSNSFFCLPSSQRARSVKAVVVVLRSGQHPLGSPADVESLQAAPGRTRRR